MNDNKSHLVFEVEIINDENELIAHEQRFLPYPAKQHVEKASSELKYQSKRYDPQYHLVEGIRSITKRDDKHEVSVRRPGFEDCDNETWKVFDEVTEGLLWLMDDFLYSAMDRNIKRKIPDLYY